MLVEEFTTLETTADGTEPSLDIDRNRILDELKLTAQKNIPKYRHMTREESVVYNCLFPVTSTLINFNQERIPLRVLGIIKHCGFALDELHVMHKAYVGDDPILIARTGQYKEIIWLIARWGEALDSFANLRKQAAKILRDRAIFELAKIKSEVAARLRAMERSPDLERLYGTPFFSTNDHG